MNWFIAKSSVEQVALNILPELKYEVICWLYNRGNNRRFR